MTNGLTRSLAARPGMAANASLASPSIDAPSLTTHIGDAIASGHFVGDGQALRLRQRRAERAVAEQHALGIQMRFAVAGQLARDAAKRL